MRLLFYRAPKILPRATFGAKLEHLLSSRAEVISRMHRPPPAEGNDLERLLGLPPNPSPASSTPPANVPIWPDEQSAAFCAVTPPIETFMEVPDEIRREQFFNTARRDDILVGLVTVIQDSGLVVTILAYDQGPRRDFDGLKLTGFCPLRQLPRYNAHGNALDSFQIGDKVRAFILDVHATGRLILSMNSKMLSRDLYGDIKLGLITDDDLPLHYKKLQNLDGKSYEAYLESTPQFRNPDGLQVLCARMGIPRSSACSLLTCFNKIRLPKSEMACELRRTQLLNFSMKHVAQGVKYFKEGRNTEALQCYNFAIEVEPTNPDAYVARGALYASIGTYSKAIDDLEKSLEIQANHANARNYLGQTLVAYAGEISRKDPTKAEQMLHRALKLDPDNVEARDALKELPATAPLGVHGDTSLRSWSKTPSPRSSRGNAPSLKRSPLSPGGPRSGGGYASHMERSRAALEQLVEEDRTRRAAKEATRHGQGTDQSPLGFYSPGRGNDRRRNTDFRDDMKSGSHTEKNNMDHRGDLPKIVITRNRSGRIIRCRDDDDMGDGDRGRQDGGWKRAHDDDAYDRSKRGRLEPEGDHRGTRRVFTPPQNARPGEYGSLTVHENENDLPMTSKSLQERVQARLRAIERRHQLEDGSCPPETDLVPGPEKVKEGSFNAHEEFAPGDSPRGGFQGHWRGGGSGPINFDRRGGFHRPDYYGGRGGGGYFGRGRGRAAPRWRGQWDDYRGRRPNWYPNRFDDRRRDGPPGGGSYDRRRRRHGSTERSPRSSRSRSNSRSRSRVSRSRSRSLSRGVRSSSGSRSPVRPGNRGRVISRARIKTPPLAPLTNAKRADSDDNLAELDQFVAQLKAKRQMEQQFQHQQQQYLAQFQEQPLPAYPGPQQPPDEDSSQAADQGYQEANYGHPEQETNDTDAADHAGYSAGDSGETDDQEPPEPDSPVDRDEPGEAVDSAANADALSSPGNGLVSESVAS
ncbi:hypothetical protein T265_00854 [Opisthorchis viverrini]|uniref:S1 motif domain-containing protein n=1 Tax=Opisthorchis viverrini TaxID=6198 RepID=A0A075A4I1_OPIVI|nr:hypothetical protein T265_00854 [Opisthorchis viverrini]KER33152.1 hypothetical protein T265_00854 [Opisthorchis viverrini]